MFENILLVLFDVDGVLTDGSIYTNEYGEMFKQFNVKDGLAIELLHSHGIKTGIVSGKCSEALKSRAKSLGFNYQITGVKNKLPAVEEICKELSISLSNVAFIGDDILDIPVMDKCGLSACPNDAHELVFLSSTWILRQCGGQGVAREFSDKLLLSKGLTLIEAYRPLINLIKKNQTELLVQ